jgi:hypothetical protein
MKKLLRCGSLLIAILCGCQSPAEHRDAITARSGSNAGAYLLDTGNLNIAQQAISGTTLVWAGGNVRDKNSDHLLNTIYEYDLDNQHKEVIARSLVNGQTDETQISSRWICWTDWFSPLGQDWSIYAYSRQDKTIRKIAESRTTEVNSFGDLPRLSLSKNGLLAWIASPNGSDPGSRVLHIHNLNTQEQTRIEDSFEQSMLDISDRYAVWNSGTRLKLYSIADQKIIVDEEKTSAELFPKVSDRHVVWKEGDQLMMETLADRSRHEVFSGDIFYFDVSDDYVVWQSQHEIYAYRIQDHAVKKLNDADGMLPVLNDQMVVWQSQDEAKAFTRLQVVNLDQVFG